VSAPPRSAYAAWIAVCVIWGTTYLGIRVALEATPPMLMGGIRWTIAGTILVLASLLRGERMPASALWGSLALQGLMMIGFGNGFVNWAEQHVPSGLAAVTLATSPFWMSGVEAFRGDGERLSRESLIGLLLGFTGIVVLVWPDLRLGDAAGLQFTLGVIALQCACLGWAIGSSYSRRHPHGGSVVAATAVQMLFGGVMMLAAGTLVGEWPRVHLEGRGLVALTYLILVGSIGGFVSYIYALQHLPVATVSLYAYANPLIAVVLGALLLGEPFTMRTVISMAIVFAGMVLVRRRKRPSSPQATEGRPHQAPGTQDEAPHQAPGTRHQALS
jgi:drug/metabolite transporter (DMT)-like permease